MSTPDLQQSRARINEIDAQIMELFRERMDVTADVAAYKASMGMPIFDKARERANVERVSGMVTPEMAGYAAVIETVLMEASREAQHRMLGEPNPMTQAIRVALEHQPPYFPRRARVACQGVEGAYQQMAVERMFRRADLSFCESFEDVFEVVEAGECAYGVLPIENSTAGSVNRVYDLMRGHDFHIVKSCRLRIEHNLLAAPGVRKQDIRIVYSHEQAIHQCARYLATSMPRARVHFCENTAKAAEKVAQSGSTEVAAIASRDCAPLYGLQILERGVQDQSNNYTRFVCIAKDLVIFPGADRTSLMMVLRHEPGSLYRSLAKLYALDINLLKLESRPIPGRDFEFMFYFDIECPVAAPEFLSLMDSLSDVCEECRYLGSYAEVL